MIEIKGYQTEQWKCKQAANPDVMVLGKDEMQPILDFVIAKYGKDFIRLYERRVGRMANALGLNPRGGA